jgi:hypothetical protein
MTFSHPMQILRESGGVRSCQEGTRRMTSLRSEDLHKRVPGILEMILATK